jgi:co-chaperonin GroES (HSP10)
MTKNSYKVTPIGDRILVKPVERKETTTGGIYLPESQQKQIPEGIIISKGAKVSDELNVGDKVRWLMVMADEIPFSDTRKFYYC